MPKISALTSLAQASVDTAADVLPIVDATAPATTKKVTVQAMVNAGLAAAAPQGGIFALTGALTVSGNSTLGVTRVSAADVSSPMFGVSGTTRGVRILTSSYGTAIEGVDNTLVGSYQPLNVIGSVVGAFTTASGSVLLGTGSNLTQFSVTHTASAVNCFSVTGSAAGGFSNILESVGSDSNIQNLYASKGTYGHVFRTGGSGGFTQFVINATASAVNYILVSGAATGGLPTFTMQGSDANISAYMATKGTGSWRFATGGGDQFRIINVASAVNYWSAYGAATGNGPIFYADGSDPNVSAGYSLKGAGSHVFYTGSTSAVQLVIGHVASTVNWPVISGSATGNAVTISTNGSDTNRSIAITPAGTGVVTIGTGLTVTGGITATALGISGTFFKFGTSTPASASATGEAGQFAWDASYIYVCTAANTWKRAALATW